MKKKFRMNKSKVDISKAIGSRTIKTAIAATISVFIAESILLKYAASAGIIAILSVQGTKRRSFDIAKKRIYASIIAIILSAIVAKSLGGEPITLGVFLLIFIPITVRLNVIDGMISGTVLATHILFEKNIGVPILINEVTLTFIGVTTALLVNLYMPSLDWKMEEYKLRIEEGMKEILNSMGESLRTYKVSIKEEELFQELELKLNEAKNDAYRIMDNSFLDTKRYYMRYVDMRVSQFERLKRMREHFRYFYSEYNQTVVVANYTKKVASSINEENTGIDLLNELKEIRDNFKEMHLPKTREEFENRAMLFQFLNDIEEFILIKARYKYPSALCVSSRNQIIDLDSHLNS